MALNGGSGGYQSRPIHYAVMNTQFTAVFFNPKPTRVGSDYYFIRVCNTQGIYWWYQEGF
jgi:hypothetical protein